MPTGMSEYDRWLSTEPKEIEDDPELEKYYEGLDIPEHKDCE